MKVKNNVHLNNEFISDASHEKHFSRFASYSDIVIKFVPSRLFGQNVSWKANENKSPLNEALMHSPFIIIDHLWCRLFGEGMTIIQFY